MPLILFSHLSYTYTFISHTPHIYSNFQTTLWTYFFPIHFLVLLEFHFRISFFNILSLSLSLPSIWVCASATMQEQKTKAEAECRQIKSYKICFVFGLLPQHKDRRSDVFGVTIGVLGFTTSSLKTFSKSKSLLSNLKKNLSLSFFLFFFFNTASVVLSFNEDLLKTGLTVLISGFSVK